MSEAPKVVLMSYNFISVIQDLVCVYSTNIITKLLNRCTLWLLNSGNVPAALKNPEWYCTMSSLESLVILLCNIGIFIY